MKLNVFDNDMRARGRLLVLEDIFESNVLWKISSDGSDETSDLCCLDVINRLQEMCLFKKIFFIVVKVDIVQRGSTIFWIGTRLH